MSLKKFYADPYLQIRSFVSYTVVFSAICAALYTLRTPEFYQFTFSWWHLALIPLGIYAGGLSAVYIHNATHQSFPNRWLNGICGRIAGIHQLWGYKGWKLIHLVHHQYSDHEEHDPHPTKNRMFSEYFRNMFLRSSLALSRRYREHFGNTPRTRVLQTLTVGLFVVKASTLLAFWYLLLGPAGFIFGYIPSLAWNHYMFAHINYYCHPEQQETGETRATNLNHNWYYRIANFLWHGIYFHGNHHRKPMLFNPRKLKESHAQA